MRRLRYLLIILGWIVLSGPCAAQGIRVHGHFRADTSAIGEVVPYVLTASYPRETQVLFPDSTFAFTPFEFARKQSFPTRTSGAVSYDSAVYFLSTFEIDSLQKLRLPVFVVQPLDCVAVFATADTLRLNYRVTIPLDSIAVEKLPLKTNTAYQRVKWIFNYPILLILAGVLLVAAVAVWVIFGKQIRRFFALRRLRRGYENFQAQYLRAIDRLNADASSRKAEDALLLWKRYMEELEAYPFTKSTSREILRKFANEGLGNALRSIDRSIYGGYGANRDPFVYLQTYSHQQFEKRQAELRNG